jgi:predicted enzyme related to lactoylglutathione lyase
MPVIDHHPNGSLCWMELHTTDQNAAKQFYGSLFGWEATDYPMGPDGDYTIFRLQGRDCSAACTLRKDLRENGVPPHWMLYISTDNVDESTKRVAELGGTVLAGPFDVAANGRMSVIADPTGAHFSLWQANQTAGIGIAGEDHAFCWADLLTPDRNAAKKFYAGLFGWVLTPGEGKDESGYWHIVNGKQMIGGMPPAEVMQAGMTPHWSIYYLVADCEAATAKATSLGAAVYVPPMTIEGAGVMSVLADPQGAVFALFKSTM